MLEAYDGYWEGRPNIDRYLYRIIPDSATMFLELSAGNLDEMGLDPVQYTRQTDTEFFKKSYRKYRYLADAYTYLGFNLNLPLFQDKRVRQAISHAVNKQEIIDIVLLGLGQEATGPYKPGTWPHNPDVRKYPHDQARAKALLAEAGWSEGARRGAREGREALRLHADDQPGEQDARQGGGGHPEEPQGGRDRRLDPHRRVGGLPQGVREPEEVRRGDPRLDDPAATPTPSTSGTPRRPGRPS